MPPLRQRTQLHVKALRGAKVDPGVGTPLALERMARPDLDIVSFCPSKVNVTPWDLQGIAYDRQCPVPGCLNIPEVMARDQMLRQLDLGMFLRNPVAPAKGPKYTDTAALDSSSYIPPSYKAQLAPSYPTVLFDNPVSTRNFRVQMDRYSRNQCALAKYQAA